MIFYILWAGTTVLAFVWAIRTARQRYDSWGSSWSRIGKIWGVTWRFVVAAVLGPVCAGLVALIVAALAHAFGGSTRVVTETANYELVALANGSSVSGQFFLGTGSVDGKNVFNYVTDDGGYSTLRQADADQSSIWQDEDEDPYLDVSRIAWRVDWAMPSPIFSTLRYDFHIPDGSVYNGYSVNP